MRLLTLNTHSLMESDYPSKIEELADAIKQYKPSIIALQEVMQPKEAKRAEISSDFVSVGQIPLKEGNYLIFLYNELIKRNLQYQYIWLGIKRAYDIFDEGVAILTLTPVSRTKAITLSQIDNYDDWKTRKALGVEVGNSWYFSVHLGFWDDYGVFQKTEILSLKKSTENMNKLWLLGDFNAPADERNKGYDMLTRYWHDSYFLAKNKDNGNTVKGKIDGWDDKDDKRIDFIFTNEMVDVQSSQTIFNGTHRKIISDHYGILLTI